MNEAQNFDFNTDYTGYFNGKSCRVIEEYHIILDKGGKATGEFVESEEFQILERAGIEVHTGAYS